MNSFDFLNKTDRGTWFLIDEKKVCLFGTIAEWFYNYNVSLNNGWCLIYKPQSNGLTNGENIYPLVHTIGPLNKK